MFWFGFMCIVLFCACALVCLHFPTRSRVVVVHLGSHTPGLHWLRYILELPFSVARWLTIPPCDGLWGRKRRLLAIVSTTGFFQIFYLSIAKLDGYDDDDVVGHSKLPISVFLLLIGLVLSALLYFTSNDRVAPRYYPLFSIMSFLGACAWLNLLADECIGVLQAWGVIWNISTSKSLVHVSLVTWLAVRL